MTKQPKKTKSKTILLEYSEEEIKRAWNYIYEYCKEDVSVITDCNIIDKVVKKVVRL